MESIETLNTRLIDFFGTDSSTGRPMFQIVWANDQLEKRLVNESESGVHYLFPEVKEVKKYPYLKDLYVLEQLVLIPETVAHELPTARMSYEPLWAYCDGARQPVPPVWPATKFIIDTMYAAKGVSSLRKYVDSELNTTEEGRQQRVTNLQEELFGDETDAGDALRYKEGIVVPNSYDKGAE